MSNNFENSSTMLKSADLSESADSSLRNQSSLTLEQLNYKAKEQKLQRKFHEKIDQKEHLKADTDLQNNLSSLVISNQVELDNFLATHFSENIKAKEIAQKYFEKQKMFGTALGADKLSEQILIKLDNKEELSTADKVKNYKEQLTEQGKPQTEILNLLISMFENEKSVSKWVKNWRNFQKLHQFAESKPPAERKAIQNIIARADFSSTTAFETSLLKISQSSEISASTKLEISREFSRANVFSVDDMDYTLKEVKNHKEKIENAISTKSREKNSLDSEISELEDDLDSLSLDDPKRQELKAKIEQKKEVLEQTENEIDRLEKGKPKNVSFQLREGFSAKLNPDGSRSIKINSQDFSIKLPSNFLPLTTTKNLRAINLSFPFLALKNQNIADSIFSPNLDNNSVPTKSQRDIGHLILSSLGIDDTRILSEEKITQLKKDLSVLTPKNGETGQENLIELGIYDVASQSLDKSRFKEVLEFIRENRGLQKDTLLEKLIDYSPKLS